MCEVVLPVTERVGFDLSGFRSDYTTSAEENLKAMREAYRKAYGTFPEDDKSLGRSPPPPQSPQSRRSPGG